MEYARSGLYFKTAEFGYDGKGQQKIAGNLSERKSKTLAKFDSDRAVLEERVELDTELSVLVAREPGRSGNL